MSAPARLPLHAWRPFVVQAGAARVRDIGTVFNVRLAADGGVQVSVIEGTVEVSSGTSGPAGVGGAAQRIDAGHAWRLDAGGAAGSVAPADTWRLSAWQRGQLVFDGAPLAAALAKVQRYRRGPIRVLDERAARMHVSGVYDTAAIEALIDALPATLAVRVERKAGGSVTVSSRR